MLLDDRFPQTSNRHFSLFEELDVTQRVDGGDAADWTDTVRCVAYFFVRVENKICRVDNLSTLLPKCPEFVGISRDFKSISHRESELQFVDGFLGFVERVDG